MTLPSYLMDRIWTSDKESGHGSQAAGRPEGFSLIEMMMVVTVILIVASIATPVFTTAIVRTREALLRDHLFTLRTLIDRFTLDNGRRNRDMPTLYLCSASAGKPKRRTLKPGMQPFSGADQKPQTLESTSVSLVTCTPRPAMAWSSIPRPRS